MLLFSVSKTHSDLSSEHFTFCKFPIYREPFETVRNAGRNYHGKKPDYGTPTGSSETSPKSGFPSPSLSKNRGRSSWVCSPSERYVPLLEIMMQHVRFFLLFHRFNWFAEM